MKKKVNNSKLIAYSATAGAALVIAPNAFGTIIHNPNANISFGEGQGGTKELTMEGSNAEFSLLGWSNVNTSSSSTSFTFFIIRKYVGPSVCSTNSLLAKPLATSMYVGPSDNTPNKNQGRFLSCQIRTGSTSSRGYWTQDGQTKYCGVSFNKNDGSGAKVYGWIKVERLSKASGKVISWAYEDDGTKIPVGAVPEPTTGLALLALGAAGIARYRRK